MSLRWLRRVLGRSLSRTGHRTSTRLFLEPLEDRWLLSGFEVTTTADAGPGSLRQAILDANAAPGTDTITFHIGGGGVQTVRPASALPAITDPVILDGTTQPGFAGSPLIELSGSSVGFGAIGLRITAGSSTLRGLVINRFQGRGISLEVEGGNVVVGSYIGTDVTGTQAAGNRLGIFVNSPNNRIGGTAAADRNLISGNFDQGIFVTGCGTTPSPVAGTLIQGNYIGTDVTGTLRLGNTTGVDLSFTTTASILVGGTAPGAGNVISGNEVGVGLTSSRNNVIQGNFIGTNATGTAAVPNREGIRAFSGSSNNLIGGSAPGARNLISGNIQEGVSIRDDNGRVQGNWIGTDITGTRAIANFIGVAVAGAGLDRLVGGTALGEGNLISGNTNGLVLSGGLRTLVQGNLIGTDPTGTAAVPNTRGVIVNTGSLHTIGGTTPEARNLISGNIGPGVEVNVGGNTIQGNFIGTDVTGFRPLGNGTGVFLIPVGLSNRNTIGGTAPGAGNLISGNRGDGIHVTGDGENRIEGNLIGTNPAGTAALANGGHGIFLSDSPFNCVGGAAPGSGNVISGNAGSGILIAGANSRFNRIQGNYIGTDVTGTVALGNGGSGVTVAGSTNTVGGTAPGAGNLISGNTGDGVVLSGPNNVVQGNLIGTDVTGTAALGNATGVRTTTGAGANTLGGVGAGNVISGNRNWGISLASAGNVVWGNLIGTDVTGTRPVGNGGFGLGGVFIGASDNAIGGATEGAGNLISGNSSFGILVNCSAGNVVRGNFIGTDVTGTQALGNGVDGIFLAAVRRTAALRRRRKGVWQRRRSDEAPSITSQRPTSDTRGTTTGVRHPAGHWSEGWRTSGCSPPT